MDCVICLDSIIEDQKTIQCGHNFHKKCLYEWSDQFNWLCPLCRNPTFVLRRKSKMLSVNGENFYCLIFDDEKYIVNDKDYLAVKNRLGSTIIETDDKEYNELIMTIILFSIMKTNSLDEAIDKISNFLNS